MTYFLIIIAYLLRKKKNKKINDYDKNDNDNKQNKCQKDKKG